MVNDMLACVRFLVVSVFTCTAVAQELRMNQIQVIATHNSYHIAKEKPVHPDLAYSQPPLDIQLDQGVRGFELDVYLQPEGYFKVLHVPKLDELSTCDRFTDCLTVIRDWSIANPGHVPIIAHIEVKDRQRDALSNDVLIVDGLGLDNLDAEVRSVFEPGHLLTPDDVRGDAATLNEAVTGDGWPWLDEVRGRCIVILHNRGRHREAFIAKTPTLEGRAMFTFGEPGAPDAAFVIHDRADVDRIQSLVKQGYIVRTRDGGPNNPDRQFRAFESGAQLISTDYPFDWKHEATGYSVRFPDARIVRANPVNASELLVDTPIEP